MIKEKKERVPTIEAYFKFFTPAGFKEHATYGKLLYFFDVTEKPNTPLERKQVTNDLSSMLLEEKGLEFLLETEQQELLFRKPGEKDSVVAKITEIPKTRTYVVEVYEIKKSDAPKEPKGRYVVSSDLLLPNS